MSSPRHVQRPARHHRGHARRKLQPRHAPAHRVRWVKTPCRHAHAARSSVLLRRRPRSTRFREVVTITSEIKRSPRAPRASASRGHRQHAAGCNRYLRLTTPRVTQPGRTCQQSDLRGLRVDHRGRYPGKARYLCRAGDGYGQEALEHQRAADARAPRVAEAVLKREASALMALAGAALRVPSDREDWRLHGWRRIQQRPRRQRSDCPVHRHRARLANVSESHAGISYAHSCRTATITGPSPYPR